MVGLSPIAACALLASTIVVPASGNGLTRGDLVGRAYDAILDARVEQFDALLSSTCGPAPAEACRVLRAAGLWWQILQDWDNKSQDARLLQLANEAIAAADAWAKREPKSAEAWFYLGAAYGVRLQWRGLRGDRLSAARDGKRVKDMLERALSLEPGLDDASFGVGLYHYYADIMPTVLKFLRWLLLMPGGDREQGLREMMRTHDRGEVLRGEADFQIHQIYLWYENRPERALEILADLRKRYPHNPIFVRLAAEAQDVYSHDTAASLSAYRELAALGDRGQVGFAALAAAQGRLGAAQQYLALQEGDRTIELARQVVAARPAAPYGAVARAQLLIAQAEDSLGHREAALAAYRAAIAAAPADDPIGIRRTARAGLGRIPEARRAEARRLSLEGWRLLERGQLDQAATALGRSVEINPAESVARYRFGKLLAARGENLKAMAEFERVLAARPAAPGPTLAAACFEAGRLSDAAGNRARALELYRRATSTHGATAETREAAAAAMVK